MSEKIEFQHKEKFPSSIEYLDKIERLSSKIAREAGFDESTVDDISIALTELVNNAIHHGNRDDRAKKVTVTFTQTPEALHIAIRDEGGGFEPEKLNDPLHPENLLADNGRGIYLVKALMDNVDYRFPGNGTEVIITKKRKT